MTQSEDVPFLILSLPPTPPLNPSHIETFTHTGLFPSCLQNKEQSTGEYVGENRGQESQRFWLGGADPSKLERRAVGTHLLHLSPAFSSPE